MRRKLKGEIRSDEQILEHYIVEVELANTLKNSTVDQRRDENLYTAVYDEMLRRVPHHQLLTRKESAEDSERAIRWQLGLMKRFVSETSTVVEIGAGDCLVSFRLSQLVDKVFGVDVSNLITAAHSMPSNFELIISDGTSIPLPDKGADVVYSNQLMEHIHPDDAKAQLREIFRVLRIGGNYVCITPNKANGPWDISYYYDDVAKGLHLKEYTISELVDLFGDAGFRTFRAYVGARGMYMRFPIAPIIWLEKLIGLLPPNPRVAIGQSLPFRMILGIKLVGTK
jgi:SAM-dependent methyltransferase